MLKDIAFYNSLFVNVIYVYVNNPYTMYVFSMAYYTETYTYWIFNNLSFVPCFCG